ncbi:serine protease inhibitor Cvsi-2-like [Mytilus trossulus]|uniref:serine protease inhibitor Cvsi-2-like n=1 Tax=Mytilus trossulus TaxID=6551 RepID=UPI003004329C
MNKFLAIAVVLSVGAVLVLSERCKHYSDCTNTQCMGNGTSHIVCEHDACTCISHLSCDDVADCTNAGQCHKRDNHYHCVDHICLCLKDDVIDKPGN